MFVLAATIIGCAGEESKPAAGGATAQAPAERGGGRKTVLFLGTSLTAAYGLDPE